MGMETCVSLNLVLHFTPSAPTPDPLNLTQESTCPLTYQARWAAPWGRRTCWRGRRRLGPPACSGRAGRRPRSVVLVLVLMVVLWLVLVCV